MAIYKNYVKYGFWAIAFLTFGVFFLEYKTFNQPKCSKSESSDFKVVRSLACQGLEEEAVKLRSKTIEKHPIEKIPDDLKNLKDLSNLNNFPKRTIYKINEKIFPFITDFLLFLSFVFFIYSIPIFICRIFFRTSYSLEITDFSDEAITLKVGKASTAMFKKSLIGSGELGEKPTVDIAFEPTGKFEPSLDLSKTAVPLGIFLQLFQNLSRSKSFKLSGYFENTRSGVELTLILQSSDNRVWTEKFLQSDYDPEMEMAKDNDVGKISKLLSKPAAIWVLFKIDFEAAKKWLGLASWRSYAYSRVGGDWIAKGNVSNARKLLYKSLLDCKTNRFALFNLGTLDIQDHFYNNTGKINKYFLNTAKKISEEQSYYYVQNFCQYKYKSESIPSDVVWYKVMYQLAVIDEYNIISKSTNGEDKTKNINNLTKNIHSFLDNSNYFCPKNNGLKEFLSEFKPACKILEASILVRLYKRSTVAHGIIKNLQKSYRIVSHEELDDNGNLNLSELETSSDYPIVSPRTYYNLACYYAARTDTCDQKNISKEFEILCCYLKYALNNDKSLAKWALNDPSFDFIKSQPQLNSTFFEIVDSYSGTVQPTGDEWLESFVQQGFRTFWEIIAKNFA